MLRSLLRTLSFAAGLVSCALVGAPVAHAAGCSDVSGSCPAFGYYTTDGRFDSDSDLDSIRTHTNLVYRSVHINDPTGTVNVLRRASQFGLKVILAHPIIFDDLNADQTDLINPGQWNVWRDTVRSSGYESAIGALYVVDEPYWVGRKRWEGSPDRDTKILNALKTMVGYYKRDFPSVPVAMVEAYPVVHENASTFVIPDQMDWVGFDCYTGWDNCEMGISIPEYFRRLQSRMTSSQKLLMVLPGVTRNTRADALLRWLNHKFLDLYRNPGAEGITRPFKGMFVFDWANTFTEGSTTWYTLPDLDATTRLTARNVGRWVLNLPLEGYLSFPFDGGDARRTTVTGDWRYGSYKAECAVGEPIAGISKYTSGSYRPHAVLCAQGDAARYTHQSCRLFGLGGGDHRGTTSTGEWAPGYVKAECGTNEYIAGVSQTPDGRVDGILCCAGAPSYVTHNQCSPRVILNGDSREQAHTGDWDSGFYKAECALGRYAAGVSRSPDSSGQLHSLLCCGP